MANISKVVLPSTDEYDIKDTVARNGLNGKQDTLVSGTNIKTINNTSLLGSGNINISGGSSDVFVAEYDVTTYAELSAAINADKRIIIVKNDGTDDVLYYVNKYHVNVERYTIELRAIGYNSYMLANISSDDTWIGTTNQFKIEDGVSIKQVIIYDLTPSSDIVQKVGSLEVDSDVVPFINDPTYGFGPIISYSSTTSSSQFQQEFMALLSYPSSNDLPKSIKYKVINSYNTGMDTWSRNVIEYQRKLVSGTSIKTINDTSLLGSGNITIGGEDNVQSDWNQTNTSADDYIKNKPTIPVVDQTYDATSTNAQSGVAVASAISDSDNIFVVERNVTTYNELVAAVEAGKYLCIYEFVSGEYALLWIDYAEKDSDGIYLSYFTGYGKRTYFVSTSDVWSRESEFSFLRSDEPLNAPSLAGQIPSSVTAVTQSSGDNSTKLATTAYVDGAVAALPEPMIFKGSLGTGGTITTLPAASSSNEGFVYKVITAGTYDSQAADIGDTFISDGSDWVLIPSGDEPSGTVTSIATGNGLTGGPITSSGTISLDTAYGDTVNPFGSKTANYVLAAPNGSNGTPSFRTLVADDIPSITKSKISDFPSSMPASDVYDWAKASTKPTYTANEVGAVPISRTVNSKALSSDITLDASDVGASSATNWLNGSQTGSVRTSGSKEEDSNYTIGQNAVAEGYLTAAYGGNSHAEGLETVAVRSGSHSEGQGTEASGVASHAEGESTEASGVASHAEGNYTTAKGDSSHAEGVGTIASGHNSHVQGKYNIEDSTAYPKTADTSVDSSKTYYTLSNGKFSEVSSPTTSELSNYYEYMPGVAKQAFIIGNGNSANRSNAFTVNWDGEMEIALNTSASSGTDKEIYDALVALGWDSDVIV